jgi:pimeloyl-ACP methyl ester carboxylesterase
MSSPAPFATFVLIPGAGGRASGWRLLEPELRRLGHDVIAIELPGGDDRAGLAEYTEVVVEAIGERRDLTFVATRWADSPALWCATGSRSTLLARRLHEYWMEGVPVPSGGSDVPVPNGR